MSYSISITKRANGGYTVVTEGYTCYPSEVSYHGTDEGVILFMQGMRQLRFYHPAEWTIQTVTGFTTVLQVCNALDALGVLPADALDDIKVLISAIAASIADIQTAVEKIDDWDESDRSKVNIIAGQEGVDGNSGNKSDKTLRVAIATDQPQLTYSLKTVDDNSSDIKSATETVAGAIQDSKMQINVISLPAIPEGSNKIGEVDVASLPEIPAGSNLIGKFGIDQVTEHANEVVVKSGDINEASASDIKAAVELIDDTVKTLGTDTYTEAATKAIVVGAFRRDAETSMVDTTGDVAPLQVDAAGRLKVASQGRTTSPTVLIGTGSAQNVTTGWVDHGAEVATNGAYIFDLWVAVVHTNSVNVRVRILGKHTATTGTEFQIPIKNISSDVVKVLGHYYELDSDATQNILLDWDVSGVPYVQVQIQCETVGAVADTVSSDYTLMF